MGSRRLIPWLVLGLPLALLWLAALGYDGREPTAAADGESTYLMQAESLLQDLDLTYRRVDFDRYFLGRYGVPTNLELASGSEGRTVAYDRPPLYALWLAPFLALRPELGFAIANALLLSLCLLVAVRRLGADAALRLSLLVFGSAVFAHVFFVAGDLFLFCLTLVAFASLRGPLDDSPDLDASPSPRRVWTGAALLTVVVTSEPILWPLLLIYVLAVPRSAAKGLRLAAVLGFFLGFFALGLIFWWHGGGLGFFGTSRFKFTPATGFPAVDFALPQWRTQVAQLSALHWDGALKLAWGFDARLWLWNLVHLWLGQSFGLLPYFLPVWALLLLTRDGTSARRAWWIGFAAWVLTLLIFRPFDLSGGESTVANRLFLPMAAASVVAWGRRWRRLPKLSPAAAGTAITTLTLVFAAPFMAGLWRDPGAYPVLPETGYRYPTTVAKSLLPYELSQRPMPGGALVDHLGVRVRFMDQGLEEEFTDMLSFAGDRPVKLWIASTEPLRYLQLAMDEQAPSEIHLGGAQLVEKMLLSDGGIAFRVEPELFRRHNMWWSPNMQYLYRLGFQLPEPKDSRIRLRLVAETDADLASRPEEDRP